MCPNCDCDPDPSVTESDNPRCRISVHLFVQKPFILESLQLSIPLDKWDLKRMNEASELSKNFQNPPFKDTIQITGGGYAIIRFNPPPGI